jgi:hypothetical protein
MLACSPDIPRGVPEGATAVHLDRKDHLYVDGTRIDDGTVLKADLTDGLHTGLIAALASGDGPLWISAPAETPWMLVRKMVFSAEEAGRKERWLGDNKTAFPSNSRKAGRLTPDCRTGPVKVEGMTRRMTIELFHGSHGTWVEATVIANAVVDGEAAIGLPARCWQGATCAQTPVPDQCAAPTQAAGRIPVAGTVGCLLPIRKEPGDERGWPAELSANLRTLGWKHSEPVTLLIEAKVPWAAVTSVLDGFSRADLPQPTLGLPLVEGHGSPPPCTIGVRVASQLDQATSAWFGSQINAMEAPEPPGQARPDPQ